MVLTAFRGALSFLTRLPVGRDERAWEAFRTTPSAFPLAGLAIGLLAALPLLLPLPAPSRAAGYLVALYLLTGVTHLDGLADLGDGAAVHGDAERRLAVMADAGTGAGGTVAVALTLTVLALGAIALADAGPVAAVAVVVAAEVGAKTAMALLVVTGTPAHDGMGAAVLDGAAGSSLLPVGLAAAPVLVLAPVSGAGTVAAVATTLLAALVVARLVGRWADGRLNGVTGDVLGATNELARLAGVHAGVVAWTLW